MGTKNKFLILLLSFGFIIFLLFQNFTWNPGAHPPKPLIDQEARLNRMASDDVLEKYRWGTSQEPMPRTNFPYLMPSLNTKDLRLKTENCDLVGIPGNDKNGDPGVCLFTATPDAVNTPLSQFNHVPISKPLVLPASDFYIPTTRTGTTESYVRGSRFICEDSSVNNPFACDDSGNRATSGKNDCYEMYHYGTLNLFNTDPTLPKMTYKLAGRRMKVIVTNPKTAQSKVSRVIYLTPTPVMGPEILKRYVFTPAVSGDGKLLIGGGTRGLMYSYSSTPCDLMQWSEANFRPITAMNTDNRLATYGIAKFPIRDSEGKIVTPVYVNNELIHSGVMGSYIWMDTRATMLFFNSSVGNNAYYMDPNSQDVKTRYRVDEVRFGSQISKGDDLISCNSISEIPKRADCFASKMQNNGFGLPGDSADSSMSFFGLWTNGKIVMPDTPLNKNTLGIDARSKYVMTLYSSNAPSSMTLSATRVLRKGAAENAFFHLQNLRADNPMDVVWQVSNENDMDEIAFDNYIQASPLIVSDMNASLTNECNGSGLSTYCFGQINDGFKHMAAPRTWDLPAVPATNTPAKLFPNYYTGILDDANRHLQNSATSRMWKLPSHGELKGVGRIEPISAGGVHGAGLYLNGQNWVEYLIPSTNPASMSDFPWHYSLWIDPRTPSRSNQVLFSHSTGTRVVLRNPSTIDVYSSSGELMPFVLPAGLALQSNTWTHMAFNVRKLVSTSGSSVELFINGFRIGSQVFSSFALIPAPGNLVLLGDSPAGNRFVGWIDEFRMTSRTPDVEEICRSAHGTLVALESADDPNIWNYASQYPASSHNAISAVLGVPSAQFKYFCETSVPFTRVPQRAQGSYCIDHLRRPAQLESPDRCIGNRIVFPEGPIVAGLKRPDTTKNKFCLSCHLANHPSASLTPAALQPSPWGPNPFDSNPPKDPTSNHLASQADPRRAPMEPVMIQNGVKPVNMFCSGVPQTSFGGIIYTDVWTALCN